MSRMMIRDLRMFEQAISHARRTNNPDVAEKARDKLLKSAVIFADWLSKHHLDELNED